MSYKSTVLADSPAVLWPLNETSGTTAADATGNGRTGTYTGGFTLADAAGPVAGSGSVLLNGSTGRVQSSYNPALSAVTLECWVNLNGISQGGSSCRLISNDHTSFGNNNGFDLYQGNGAGLQCVFGNGTSSFVVPPVGTTLLPASGWSYVVATWASPNVRLYLNAVQVASSSSASGTLQAGSNNFASGFNPAYSGDFLHGLIAWVAIYPAALSQGQITAHYHAAPGAVRTKASLPSLITTL